MLRDRVDSPTIVVLDEADGLPATDALPRLLDVPLVSVVVICHDPDDWLARVDDRTRTRLSGHELGLDRYGVSELADILEERARMGLRPGAVERGQLETLADEVADVARNGIQSLRAAAELAAERGHSSIGDRDVQDGFERARRFIRESNLASLPFHHHVLYEMVRQHREISASKLHAQYDDIAPNVYRGIDRTPLGKRSRRNKMRKLCEYDLLECEGERRSRKYHVVDSQISSSIDFSHLNFPAV
jgi:Cdc6-like AAA superfamily ATPase